MKTIKIALSCKPTYFILFLILLGLVGILSGFIGYQSIFGYHPPPVTLSAAIKSDAFITDYTTVFNYRRNTVINKAIQVEVTKSMSCGHDGMVYEFPSASKYHLKVDSFSITHSVVIPYTIQPGTRCTMHTGISYRPNFSIRLHRYTTPDIEFIVGQKRNTQHTGEAL